MSADHLIRRVGGVELPTKGCWTIPRSHVAVHYGARTGLIRRVRGQAPAASGVMQVTEDPADTALFLNIATWADPRRAGGPSLAALLGNSRISVLVLQASAIDMPTNGAWQMRGTAHMSWVSRPVSISVTYHGLYRAGDRAKASLTIRAEIEHDFSGPRRRGPIELVADVLAVAPSAAGSSDADRTALVA